MWILAGYTLVGKDISGRNKFDGNDLSKALKGLGPVAGPDEAMRIFFEEEVRLSREDVTVLLHAPPSSRKKGVVSTWSRYIRPALADVISSSFAPMTGLC
jgi:hypothetical protein